MLAKSTSIMQANTRDKRSFFILICLWPTVPNYINHLICQCSSRTEQRSQSFYIAKQTGVEATILLSDQGYQSLPMWLFGSLFRRQGSSRPDGALMLAVRRLRSVSLMSNKKSAAEPSLTWDRLLLSSAYIKRKGARKYYKVKFRTSLRTSCSCHKLGPLCSQRLIFIMKCFQKPKLHTCDLGGEWTARDVLVIVLDQDAVVPR